MPTRAHTRRDALGAALALTLLVSSSASRPQPLDDEGVTAELITQGLFPGESPRIRLTVRAPAGQSRQVIKEERVYTRRVLRLDLIAPDGTRVPGGLPSAHAVKADDDFREVLADEAAVFEFDMLAAPATPGTYRVRVDFTPGADPQARLQTELSVTCQDLTPQAIGDRVALALPVSNDTGDKVESIELTNVAVTGGQQLLFRRLDPTGVPRISRRLGALEADSKLIAVLKTTADSGVEVHVVFNQGGDLHHLRIECVTGTVVERTVLE